MNTKKYYVVGKGQYWEFNSVREIFHYKSPAQPISYQIIGHNFNDSYFDFDKFERIKVTYVVYDYLIRVIRKEDLEELYTNEEPVRSKQFLRLENEKTNYPSFRCGPVPHTGYSRYSFYNWHRAPRTTQERRLNCKYKGFTRGKRRNLVSAWDDVSRSDRLIKQSWKKQKKRKQWM